MFAASFADGGWEGTHLLPHTVAILWFAKAAHNYVLLGFGDPSSPPLGQELVDDESYVQC